MQKNWYIVYTKEHAEMKVSHLLSKKKIENFCPFNYNKSQSLFWKKVSFEPIFDSYVFVKTTEFEILPLTKQVSGIISILYWKGKPAIIKREEIIAMKEFTTNHHDIRLVKGATKEMTSNSNDFSYVIDGQIFKVKNRATKLQLPSLGCTLVAAAQGKDIIVNTLSFADNELILQS